MRFMSIAIKIMKETFRDKKGLVFLILFPIAFMWVFGFAFSAGFTDNSPYEIAVLNFDEGTWVAYNGSPEHMNFGGQFVTLLEDVTYEDSDVNLFDVHQVSQKEADDMLMDREVACVVTIPGNFSESVSAMINETALSVIFSYFGETIIIDNGTDLNLTQYGYSYLPVVDKNATSQVIIEGDTGYINFGIVQPIIHGILNDYLKGIRMQVTQTTLDTLPEGLVELTGRSDFEFVFVRVKRVSGTEEFTIYDHQAPGIVIFALLLLSINVAVTLAREVETKKLTRLKISKMNSFDLLLGTLIPWALIAAIQVLLLFGVAVAMGFHWQGGATGIIIAIIIGTIAGISSISLGLLVASFSKSEKHASNLGTLIAVPVSFLVGSFFEVPTSLFTEALPWGQAIDGLRSVLTFGQGMEDVLPTILILSIETVFLFIIGVLAFSKTQLKAE